MSLLLASGAIESVDVLRISAGGGAGKGAGEVVYIDAAGARRTRPMSEVLALAPARWSDGAASPPPSGSRPIGASVLDLVDGQRLIGTLQDRGDDSRASVDTVLWRTERFGTMTLAIDRIARWSRSGAMVRASRPPTADRLIFANGDVQEGVIETFGSTTVLSSRSPSPGTTKTSVPLDRLDEVVFSNPAGKASGTVCWLNDGSVIALNEIVSEGDGGRLRVRPAIAGAKAESGYLLPGEVLGVTFDASGVFPLSSLLPRNVRPLGDRLSTKPPGVLEPTDLRPPTLGAADIEISGAMAFELELPIAARSLVGEVELPESAWMWGDCELVVSVSGSKSAEREAARTRVWSGKSAVALNVRLDAPAGSTLRISLEPGAYGPVQDRVVIRHAIISVNPK